MKWIAATLLVTAIIGNAIPAYWGMSARGDHWRYGFPIKWLEITKGGLTGQDLFASIDWSAATLNVFLWLAIASICFWLLRRLQQRR